MKFNSVLTLFALPILAVALPGGSPPQTVTVTVTQPATSTPISQCNTGPIQCCNSVQSASSSPVTALLGLLGVVLTDITALVGLTCTPVSILGIGGNGCTAQPVCCQNVQFNGLIAIGCAPINIL